ncbi:MAG: FG-GAP-like repeat-containing protein [Actinomycetes bacterium]
MVFGHPSPARLLRILVASTLLAALVGCAEAAPASAPGATAPEPAPQASGTTSASSGSSAPTSAECPPRAAARPTGAGATVTVLAERTARTPRVSAATYPRPDHAGRPWSQWGQGLVLPDGRFLSAIGDHLGVDGNSYLFVFEPDRGVLTRFADVASVLGHAQGEFGYGKIHAQLVAVSCDSVVAGTFWGTRTGLEYGGSYTGDHLLSIDTATLQVDDLGVPVPRHGIPSLAAHDGLVYGEAADPRGRPGGVPADTGRFFVFDPQRGTLVHETADERHLGFRAMAVDAGGRAFLAMSDGGLLRYDPGGGLTVHDGRLPAGWLRAATAPASDGTVYAVTRQPERYVALRADGRVDDLGPASGYVASVALSPDEKELYVVPGAHGDSWQRGTPLLAVDVATGAEREVVQLAPPRRRGPRPRHRRQLQRDGRPPHGARLRRSQRGRDHRRAVGRGRPGGGRAVRWGAHVGVRLGVVCFALSLAACGLPPAPRPGPGGPPASASADAGVLPSPGAAGYEVCWSAASGGEGSLAWSDATERLGVGPALLGMMAHAVAAGDINGDGWTDLFVGTFADRPASDYAVRGSGGPAPDQLLLGSADGFTVDRTFPENRGRTSGAAFADLDADGDLDLVVARNPRRGERQTEPSVVLRNDVGRFTKAAVLDPERGFRSVGVLDADGDGRLDLFVVEDRWTGGSSVLYRNEGNFSFTDATAALGLPTDVHGLGVSTADLDGDRRPDLFVSGSNRLFLGDRGRFVEDTTNDFGWATYGDEDDPAGVAAADLDGDGQPELIVGQHFNSTLDSGRLVPVRVYANRGPAGASRVRFEDVTEASGLVGLPTKSPHVEVADVDADGRPDLVTTAATASGEGPVVFRNVGAKGSLRFEAVAPPGGRRYWVTAATLDADRDGGLEVLLAEWEPAEPSRLLSVAGRRGHWLVIELGVAGTAGVGAEVLAYEAGHSGDPARLLGRLEIAAQTGYGAGAEPVARFGLGAASTVDVVVRRGAHDPALHLPGLEADRWVRVGAPC